MKIAILYNDPPETASTADQDVLMQRDAVAAALQRLGHQVSHLACSLDLSAIKARLDADRPDLVFNLVESLGGTDHLMPAATLLLDAMRVPYTGASTRCILSSSDKLFTKHLLWQAGIPTPGWFTTPCGWNGDRRQTHGHAPDAPWRVIIKAIWEHASFHLDDASVVALADETPKRELATLLQSREEATGRAYFAETFIDGREFNLSILAGETGPQVLPPAEIDFAAFPAGKPRIVSYAAKWEEASFEYQHTPRRFEFSRGDRPLLSELERLAIACWHTCALRGYARVDFRVDDANQPWVLEVNANPCLALDAGFSAAVERAGVGYDAAISRIVLNAVAPSATAAGSDASQSCLDGNTLRGT